MISVVVPIFNSEKYLKDCLNSIRNQTIFDFEVLCIDDGSTDNSKSVCESFAKEDARFVLYTKRNGGVSSARNLGLEKVKGEYVCFIDSDDIIANDYLEHLKELSQTGDFCICNYTRSIDELGKGAKVIRKYDSGCYIRLVVDEAVQHPNICMMLFKTRIINNLKLRFTQGCVRNEDYEFYMKYMTHEKSISVSDYKTYFYRDNESSASHQYNKKILTAIDAESRVADYLVRRGILKTNNLILPASVQYFVYQTVRKNNLEIYNYIHDHYNVRKMMWKMIHHPKISRKGVAWAYLFMGKEMFFKILSKI